MGAIVTYEKHIERIKNKFGDKYDYSKVDKENFNYSNIYEYYCNIHKIWFRKSCKSIYRDNNCCPECVKDANKKHINNLRKEKLIKQKKRKRYKLDEFLEIYKKKHSHIEVNLDTISYNNDSFSKGHHICIYKHIECECKKHGKFISSPISLMNNKFPCRKCYDEYSKETLIKRGENFRLNKLKTFINDAIKIHGEFYDYSKVDISNPNCKQEIICPIHGSFFQHYALHLRGEGCPHCKRGLMINSSSPSERRLLFLIQKEFPNLKFENPGRRREIFSRQSLDIYNDKYKFAIEYQGAQHFENCEYLVDGKIKTLDHKQKLDLQKYNLCKENGIKLFYFTFDKRFDNISYIDKVYTNLEELYKDIKNHIKNFEINNS